MAGPGLMPIFTPMEKFQLLFSGSDSGQVITFEDVPFGHASAGRKIIVPIGATNGSSSMVLDSVTIGGVTADIDIQRNNGGNSRNGHTAVVSATVPSGTSGDIVVTWDGASSDVTVIAVVRAVGLASSSVHDIAPDSDDDEQFSMALAVPAKGLVVAASALITESASWSAGVDLILAAAGLGGDSCSVAWRKNIVQTASYSVESIEGGDPSRYACASYG